jgi:hypothetical protein
MAETLEILLTLNNVQRIISDIGRVAAAHERLNQVTQAAAIGRATPGQVTAARSSAMSATLAQFSGRLPVAVYAVQAFAAVMENIRHTAQRYADQALFGGGTNAQSSQAAAFFGAIGITDQAGMAARLRDRIAGGGLARQAASQLGVGNVLPRGFGSTNDIRILNQLAEGLRRTNDMERARLLAIQLEEPELLRLVQMSNEQVQWARQIGQAQERVFGPEAQLRATQWGISIKQLNQQLDLLKLAALDFLLRVIGPFVGVTGQNAAGGAKDAISRNTTAVEMNTVALQSMGRQVFGGGSRARGALPAGLRGEILRHALEGEAVKLGAFRL